MIDARCNCGALALSLPETPMMVAACHCLDCQRRTGAPFGVGAFYPVVSVKISGAPKEYVRAGESGGNIRCYFCPNCGSTVFWRPDKFPAMMGVAVGAIADPNFPAPSKSVFERSKHPWVDVKGTDVEHLQHGTLPKASD